MTGPPDWLQAPVLPVLIPLLAAVLLLASGDGFLASGGRARSALRRARVLSLLACGLSLGVAIALVAAVQEGGWRVLHLGSWPAPFGIVLVVDRLSAGMLLLTQVVGLCVAVYACGGADRHGRHFHALLQLQLMGLNGAFVTGDLFNLFVFFEVLLIASYVLLTQGRRPERWRAALPYVALNLSASSLFLVGISLIYAATGTLNLAHLAQRASAVHGADAALLQAGVLLLLVVFGFKAALLPLQLWLPATYAAAGGPVAALFALMTKVGVYAMLRVHGMVFGPSVPVTAQVLLPLAVAGAVLAALLAVGAPTLARMAGWLTIASVSTVLVALGLFQDQAWSAALYYTVNSTLAVAALYLLVDLIARQRGLRRDRLAPGRPLAQPGWLGYLLLPVGASLVGLPPMPGFIGKVLILQSAGGAAKPWVWGGLLLLSMLCLLALLRAGILVFWNPRVEGGPSTSAGRTESPARAEPVETSGVGPSTSSGRTESPVRAEPVEASGVGPSTSSGRTESPARAEPVETSGVGPSTSSGRTESPVRAEPVEASGVGPSTSSGRTESPVRAELVEASGVGPSTSSGRTESPVRAEPVEASGVGPSTSSGRTESPVRAEPVEASGVGPSTSSGRTEGGGSGRAAGNGSPRRRRAGPWQLGPVGALLVALLALSAGAGPVKRYTDAAIAQLQDREGLARAVLGPWAGRAAVRPYPTEGERR